MAKGRRKDPSGKRWPGSVPTRHPSPSRQSPQLIAHAEWNAPLPPPEALRQFGEVDPSFPERIVRMAEGQAHHRQRGERVQQWIDAALRAGGLICAFASVVGVLLLSWYGFEKGHAAEAAGMVAALVAGMVAAFIKGTKALSRSEE